MKFSHRILINFTGLLICFLSCVPGYAATTPGWWVSMEGGYVFSSSDENTSIKTMPDVDLPDHYLTTHLNNRGILGIGVGYEFILGSSGNCWFPADRIGLMYDYYFNTDVTGYIDKWSTVTAYKFTYQVHSHTFWIDNQLDIMNYRNIIPFVEIAIGDAINRTSHYKESALPAVPLQDIRHSAAFQSNNHNDFAWRAGVGVNVILPQKFTIGLLYRYSNLGKAETGHSEIPGLSGDLHERLNGNEILATIRYDIGG